METTTTDIVRDKFLDTGFPYTGDAECVREGGNEGEDDGYLERIRAEEAAAFVEYVSGGQLTLLQSIMASEVLSHVEAFKLKKDHPALLETASDDEFDEMRERLTTIHGSVDWMRVFAFLLSQSTKWVESDLRKVQSEAHNGD